MKCVACKEDKPRIVAQGLCGACFFSPELREQLKKTLRQEPPARHHSNGARWGKEQRRQRVGESVKGKESMEPGGGW